MSKIKRPEANGARHGLLDLDINCSDITTSNRLYGIGTSSNAGVLSLELDLSGRTTEQLLNDLQLKDNAPPTLERVMHLRRVLVLRELRERGVA
jgi:hypothetical protein